MIKELNEVFEVEGIPSLVLVSDDDGILISDASEAILSIEFDKDAMKEYEVKAKLERQSRGRGDSDGCTIC